MKIRYLFIAFLVIFLIIQSACRKDPTYIWMIYDETLCSDPWGESAASICEKNTKIFQFFIDKDIFVHEIRFTYDGNSGLNSGCSETTGTRIWCQIKEKHISSLILQGFYQSGR